MHEGEQETTMTNTDGSGIPQDVRAAIKREAIQQTATWVIAAAALLGVFALTGWWLYFEPKIRSYIADAAGGVPTGSILASTIVCKDLQGSWEPFTEGTGRFLVGAGDEFHSAYAEWLPEGGWKGGEFVKV